jgi:hypothetical protein
MGMTFERLRFWQWEGTIWVSGGFEDGVWQVLLLVRASGMVDRGR